MKRIILIITGSVFFGLSNASAQQAKPNVDDIKNEKSGTEVVLIKTNEIPTVINKTLSENYVRPKKRTVYLDHYTQSYISYDQPNKKTYIYKKNSSIMLELHRTKVDNENVASIANK